MIGPMNVMTSSSAGHDAERQRRSAGGGSARARPSRSRPTNTTRTSWPRSHWPTTTWIRAATCCIWPVRRVEEPQRRPRRTARRRAAGRTSRSASGRCRATPWRSCSAARSAPSGVWRKASTAAWAWAASSSTVNVRSPIVMLSAPRTWRSAISSASGPLRIRSVDLARHRPGEGDDERRRGPGGRRRTRPRRSAGATARSGPGRRRWTGENA